jgi:cysteine-rich repeat protein
LVNGSCVACSIPHCITCSSLTTCTLCTTGYSVDVIFQCSTCAVLGCFTCSPGNNYLCDVCFNAGGYFLVPATQLCTSICGDGLTASGLEGCDDGNTASGDGCSSSCTL